MKYHLLCSFFFIVILTSNARGEGIRIAICIGVNKYESKGFEALNYAENDVTEFATLIRDIGYKVVLMTNTTGNIDPKYAPTKANIEVQITACLEKRNKDDVLILAFVGHGIEFNKDPDAYFCPSDAEPSIENRNKLISIEGVYNKLSLCSAGTKLIIADCPLKGRNQLHKRVPNDTLGKMPPKGVSALYACSPNQCSYEFSDLKHGVFFHHLNQGLLGKVGLANSNLLLEDLAVYIEKEVPRTVQRLGSESKQQTPTLKCSTLSTTPVVLLRPIDRQLLADECALVEWLKTKGTSRGFYTLYGPKRLAEWKTAAERGSVLGMVLTGNCLLEGISCDKEPSKAFRWFCTAAELGDVRAMHYLASCYWGGFGIEQDVAKASFWFRKAAELGNVESISRLGVCYAHGIGVKKDDTHAVELFRKAAGQGCADATIHLGVCYATGTGVQKDLPKAIELFSKEMELGHPGGMGAIGVCCLKGTGIEKDEKKGIELLCKAAELDDIASLTVLGLCYLSGNGVMKDEEKAINRLRKAAELGAAKAMVYLGSCYAEGVGGEKDPAKAVEWYRKAAELGVTDGMTGLAYCYREGVGITKDSVKAFDWYGKAAELGEVDAMYNFAWCYLNGNGVKMDHAKAIEWFRKAAALGSLDARTALKELGEE